MASVTIDHTWADGSNITVTVRGASSFPDALAQLRAEALAAYRAAVAEVVEGE